MSPSKEGSDGGFSCIETGTAKDREGSSGRESCRMYKEADLVEKRRVGADSRGRSEVDWAIRNVWTVDVILVLARNPLAVLLWDTELGVKS